MEDPLVLKLNSTLDHLAPYQSFQPAAENKQELCAPKKPTLRGMQKPTQSDKTKPKTEKSTLPNKPKLDKKQKHLLSKTLKSKKEKPLIGNMSMLNDKQNSSLAPLMSSQQKPNDNLVFDQLERANDKNDEPLLSVESKKKGNVIPKSDFWLIKFPLYMSEQLQQMRDDDVIGSIGLNASLQPIAINLNLQQSENSYPGEHNLKLMPIRSHPNVLSTKMNSKEIPHKGQVVKLLCAQPKPSGGYITQRGKELEIAKNKIPKVEIIDTSVSMFNQIKIENVPVLVSQRPFAERLSKEFVVSLLYKAFEKKSNYSTKDLVNITKQPKNYLREILLDLCYFKREDPHKFTWELKNKMETHQG